MTALTPAEIAEALITARPPSPEELAAARAIFSAGLTQKDLPIPAKDDAA